MGQVSWYYFARVPDQDVGADMRARAGVVVEFVCANLRLCSPPKIVWIRHAQEAERPTTAFREVYLEETAAFPRLPKDIQGGYTPLNRSLYEIWIRADLEAWPDLEYVVAHELRHVWQNLTRRAVSRNECERDGDAYPYGYAILKQLLSTQGRLTAEVSADIDRKCEQARAKYPGTPFREDPPA
jgi:hypothetical protein